MTLALIVVAAGRGTRAGGGLPKQWRDLRGQPVIAHTLAAFEGLVARDQTVIAIHPQDRELAQPLMAQGYRLVDGGATRAETVQAGLSAIKDCTHVLIHDAARPCASRDMINRVVAALDEHRAAAPALPVSDALWTGHDGFVTGLQDRTGLFRAQTPQGFDVQAIRAAHATAPPDAADDVEVARAAGLHVAIVPGDADNLKITHPEDFARAARILGTMMDVRLGNGFDVHAFGPGSQVTLCGVEVPHDQGLVGHSDADVGMHALTDAIYGALADGDIGQHFPPSDPQWKGAASDIFLRHAAAQVAQRGFRIANVDVTMICERPKIGPHAGAMRNVLAQILDIDVTRVSVKATTSERLGFTGREEGIAALATATLVAS